MTTCIIKLLFIWVACNSVKKVVTPITNSVLSDLEMKLMISHGGIHMTWVSKSQERYLIGVGGAVAQLLSLPER